MPLGLDGPVQVALARAVERIPNADALPGGCRYEPKWDGFRAVIARDARGATLWSRRETDLTTVFPEIAAGAGTQLEPGTVPDGELVVWSGERLDFEALQARMGRSARNAAALASQQPASLVLFDVFAVAGRDVRDRPFDGRRALLEDLAASWRPPLNLSPITDNPKVAAEWFDDFAVAGIEGLVVKGGAQPYLGGRPCLVSGAAVRQKRPTLDCMPDPMTAGPVDRHRERSPEEGPGHLLKVPTLEEVAQRAGVSRSVASRAMNNARNVSPAKREAVARAASELGYIPNATARALATSTVGSVVLAVSNDDPALFGDPFFSQVLVGVAEALERSELDLTLMLASSARGQARIERLLRSRRSDGVMLMALRRDDPLNRVAAATELPVVIGGRPLDGEARWYVDVDNRGGARLAAEHLLSSGRRRLAMISGPMDLEASVARHQGFADALAVERLSSDRVEHADFSFEGGAQAMGRLLAAHPDIDGVFAASDNMAAGAMRALKAGGRRVPEDVAVVGFDDLEIARHTEPALTTISQPIRGLGQEMATMLVRVIGGESPTPIILPTRLVVRGSAPR